MTNVQDFIKACRVKAELVLEDLIDLEHDDKQDVETLISIVGDAAYYFAGANDVLEELMVHEDPPTER